MTALTFQQFADGVPETVSPVRSQIVESGQSGAAGFRVPEKYDSGTDGMTRDEALAKLISIRHHCFVRGVLGRSAQDDFRQAFRTLNRVYVCMREGPERHSDTNGRAASQFSRPHRPKPRRRKLESRAIDFQLGGTEVQN